MKWYRGLIIFYIMINKNHLRSVTDSHVDFLKFETFIVFVFFIHDIKYVHVAYTSFPPSAFGNPPRLSAVELPVKCPSRKGWSFFIAQQINKTLMIILYGTSNKMLYSGGYEKLKIRGFR